jgi:hypothetical protein
LELQVLATRAGRRLLLHLRDNHPFQAEHRNLCRTTRDEDEKPWTPPSLLQRPTKDTNVCFTLATQHNIEYSNHQMWQTSTINLRILCLYCLSYLGTGSHAMGLAELSRRG